MTTFNTKISRTFVLLLGLLTTCVQAEVLLSNLDTAKKDAKPSPFNNGNGKAIDFTVHGTRPFEVSEVALRLKLTKDSRPVLRIVERGASGQPVRIPLNHAAGLDVPQTAPALVFKLAGDVRRAVTDDVVFVPESERVLQPGATYRLALSTETPQDKMLWLSGDVPQRNDGNARHAGQVYGPGEPASWSTRSEVVNLYEVRGRWSDKRPERRPDSKPPVETYAEISGIYPHLAMFNTARPGECGIGAVVNWA
ncbi:MAG: choice-of-anchor R domain-containing protein, partial [Planctomycetota bacterium]